MTLLAKPHGRSADRAGSRGPDTLSGMDIGISDEALEMVRARGGTAAVDYIHAIG